MSSSATARPAGATPARLGVVMLDTRFPRLPGDIGNPATFPGLAVTYRRVPRATVARVVTAEGPAADVAGDIVAAAVALAAEGVDLVATSCGFLAGLQPRLEAAVGCPVIASALSALPVLRRKLGPRAVIGVLTFDSRKLGADLLGDAGPVAVAGIEDGSCLYPAIAEDRSWFDPEAARGDAVAAAGRLHGVEGLAAVVLECTNLVPYRDAIAAVAGVPVHDITTLIAARLERR